MNAQWTVVVSFMGVAENASRFGDETIALARAMGLDTVAAVAESAATARVIVIADAESSIELTAISPEVTVVSATDTDAIDALVHSDADAPIAVMSAVLPALHPSELTELLRAAQHVAVGVVTDASSAAATIVTVRRAGDLMLDLLDAPLRAPADAAALDAGDTLRRAVTSARALRQVRDLPTLGSRTRAATSAWGLPQPLGASDRRYRVDPPPAAD